MIAYQLTSCVGWTQQGVQGVLGNASHLAGARGVPLWRPLHAFSLEGRVQGGPASLPGVRVASKPGGLAVPRKTSFSLFARRRGRRSEKKLALG